MDQGRKKNHSNCIKQISNNNNINKSTNGFTGSGFQTNGNDVDVRHSFASTFSSSPSSANTFEMSTDGGGGGEKGSKIGPLSEQWTGPPRYSSVTKAIDNRNNKANKSNNNGIILKPDNCCYDENGAEFDSDYFMKNGRYEKEKGLSWFVTGLFVVGDLAGGGLVAMPSAMIRFGFPAGLTCIILMTVIATYTSHLLGRNWLILQRRWPLLYAAGHCRKPYPEIALRAIGAKARNLVSICINCTQFGIAVVYLLLSSKNIQDFLGPSFGMNINFCVIVLIVAVALLPVTFLKSPQDFWVVVILAMFTTTLAVVLIAVGSLLDYSTCAPQVAEVAFSPTNCFLALGTFVFSYGGHAVFPTIQHDMRKPHEFTKSSILAFAIVAAMYTPVCILGYITYGNSLRSSIINSLQSVWIQQSVNMLITIHCILTLTIVFNPMNQEAEEHFKVPHEFGMKRILIRSGMMCVVVIVAETVPSFGPLLDLVGGSTLTLTALIFPTLFYLLLSANEKKADERRAQLSSPGVAAAHVKSQNASTLNNYLVRKSFSSSSSLSSSLSESKQNQQIKSVDDEEESFPTLIE